MEKENTVRIKLKKEPLGEERILVEKQKKQRRALTILCVVLFIVGIALGVLANELLTNKQNEAYSKSDEIKKIIKNNWLYRDDYDDLDKLLDNQAYLGMTTFSDDPYTMYMSSVEASDYYNNQINMSYVGIGVTYVPGSFVITRVYKNSPAEMAGFKAGDILVSVNGTELEGKTSDEVKSLVLGEEGTVVEFTVKRDGELIDITAVRGSFEQTVYARKLDDDTVYLELMSFGVNSGNECIEYLNEYKDCSKIIIDLRDNTGGYETAVLSLRSIIIFEQSLYSFKYYY